MPNTIRVVHTPTYNQHIYAMFDLALLALGEEQNLQWSCSWVDQLKESNQYHWTIVGEFTREPFWPAKRLHSPV